MLTRLDIFRFKIFREAKLSFDRLNLLAGVNGTGKSTRIQALLLLRQSYIQPDIINKRPPFKRPTTKSWYRAGRLQPVFSRGNNSIRDRRSWFDDGVGVQGRYGFGHAPARRTAAPRKDRLFMTYRYSESGFRILALNESLQKVRTLRRTIRTPPVHQVSEVSLQWIF